MAFCNSCGATLGEGSSFCGKCGAAVGGAAPSTRPIAPAPPPPTGGSNAARTILIIVGVILLAGILFVVSITFAAYHFARRSHVSQDGDHVKVETPFGNVETSKDPDQAAKDLGIDLYPGAEVQRNGASSATFGGMRTVAAMFESADPADKVCSFYRSRFPNATVSASNHGQCTIVSNDSSNMVTINVQSSGDGSRFQITSVIKKDKSSN